MFYSFNNKYTIAQFLYKKKFSLALRGITLKKKLPVNSNTIISMFEWSVYIEVLIVIVVVEVLVKNCNFKPLWYLCWNWPKTTLVCSVIISSSYNSYVDGIEVLWIIFFCLKDWN